MSMLDPMELHNDFERDLIETILPERHDYEAANRFLIKASGRCRTVSHYSIRI